MIDPKRSKYKKTTSQYTKDSIFSIIDIEESLKKNRKIPKIDESLFFYQRENIQRKFSLTTPNKNEPNSDSIDSINNNKFGIVLEDLIIENKNGYISSFLDNYIPLSLLGEGAFGLVISAYDKRLHCNCAIKILQKIQMGKEMIEFLDREVNIQGNIHHDNIVKLHRIEESEEFLYVIMELMEGGSLKDLIIERYFNKESYLFTDEECSIIIKGILNALDHIHSSSIMHRDIKPDNIMFSQRNNLSSIKICDFGLSTHFESKEKVNCGTLTFMTIDQIKKQKYDHTIDVWATGFILYILCSGGMHPIYRKNMDKSEYVNKMLSLNDWDFPIYFPLLARNLFFKLCKLNGIQRYECHKALKHPFITRIPTSSIPLTLIESYSKVEMIKKFKALLSTSIFSYCYKELNPDEFIVKKNNDNDDMYNNNNTIMTLTTTKAMFSRRKSNSSLSIIKINPNEVKNHRSSSILKLPEVRLLGAHEIQKEKDNVGNQTKSQFFKDFYKNASKNNTKTTSFKANVLANSKTINLNNFRKDLKSQSNKI